MYADGGSVYGQSLVFGQVNDTVCEITNTSSAKYTKFYGLVENQGTISGGVFYGGIKNTQNKNGVYGNVTSPYKIVCFDLNGASGSIPNQWLVNAKGATALKPTDPTRENSIFMGWYKGNNEYDFTTAVPENTIGLFTLKAKWVTTNVSTEAELKEALNAGATSIKLVSDFKLSSILDLSDKDITLDLNGHILKGDIKLSDTIKQTNPSKLTLIDSNPTATHTNSNLPLGGVLDGEITLDKTTFGSLSRLCANGGTVMIFDKHANLKYRYGNREFWCRGYYVDTVGKNKKAIAEYIRNQLQEDLAYEQMSIKELVDPFTGEPVKASKK